MKYVRIKLGITLGLTWTESPALRVYIAEVERLVNQEVERKMPALVRAQVDIVLYGLCEVERLRPGAWWAR